MKPLVFALLSLILTVASVGGEPQAVPHSLLTDDPGKMHIDLWGWESTPSYQRPAPVSPEYLAERAVDESFRRGANLLEIYPGGYPIARGHGWTHVSTLALHRHLHERDMLIHWFPHGLAKTNFESSVRSLSGLFEKRFDVLTVPPGERLDGFGSEHWETMTPALYNLCVWPYAPGAYFYTLHHRYTSTLPNEADCSASSGVGSDDQTADYAAFPSLPRDYFKLYDRREKRGGFQFWGSQAECRSNPTPNRFGGMGPPDWILKQVNDQFRGKARARGAENVSPSAIWWISEAENLTPEETRRYVYGTSQDPIRCAVATTLRSTGRDGLAGQGTPPIGVTIGRRKTPARFPFPNATAFIQNNYLRLYQFHDRDLNRLVVDPERLAHYDANSHAMFISEPFFCALLDGAFIPLASTVEFAFPEPAGYVARMQATVPFAIGGATVEEVRRYTVYNDVPYLEIEVRRGAAGPGKLTHRLQLTDHEDVLQVSADHYVMHDVDSMRPAFVLFVLDRAGAGAIHARPRQGLEVESAPDGSVSFRVGILMPEGLYDNLEDPALLDYFRHPVMDVTLADGRAVVENPRDFPVTQAVRIANPDGTPYQVYEYGRWSHRGAQPSVSEPGVDYLKCYLPAHGTAEIQRYGFLQNAARPGRGCQYTVSLSDLARHGDQVQLTAEVKEITSFLFAPRVRFPDSVKSARLDGRDWRYFEDDTVFLPNRRGRFALKVELGEDDTPRLCQTFACIESAQWQGNRLTLDAELPPWSTSIPDDFFFHAYVQHSRPLEQLEGAVLVRSATGGSVIRFKPGKLELRFDDARPALAPSTSPAQDIETHLRRKAAEEALAYLAPFDARMLRIEDAGAAVRPGDVLLWNQYFIDGVPDSIHADVVSLLRSHLAKGGGALLVSNAARIVPEVLGTEAAEASTAQFARYYRTNYAWLGAAPVESPEGHALFAGMRAEGGGYPLIKQTRFDLFQRVQWKGDVPVQGATALARLHVEYLDPNRKAPAAEAPTPVVWEWTPGAGRLLAYTCGLRFALGTPDLRPPTENEKAFVANLVRRAAARDKEPRVVVLW